MANFLSKAFFTQCFFIPEPTLTEKNLPDQAGKVHIVTGGYAGVGKELAAILFSKGATVYVAGRSQDKADKALAEIRERHKSAPGRLEFLYMDLNDLTTLGPAVEAFKAKESRLDVLVNNAGVMFPPKGTKTEQGEDMQIGTNVLGPYLFTKLLMPTLTATAKTAPANSVRVLWAASSAVQVLSPNGGVVLDEAGAIKVLGNQQVNYGQTKTANIFLAIKTQELFGSDGVVSVAFNPGNLETELQRHSNAIMTALAKGLLFPAIYGAYTELWCGWSEEVTREKGMTYVMPWGRDGTTLVRSDIQEAVKNGLADKVWDWCESVTGKYS